MSASSITGTSPPSPTREQLAAMTMWIDAYGDNQLHGVGQIARLEANLCAHFGMRHALAMANATLGLLALANAVGARGRRILYPSLSWGGSVAGALWAGSQPEFGDVQAATLTLDPAAAYQALTPDTIAVVGVDLYGVPADDFALRHLADERGIWYFHDAAQSFGAHRDGRPAGTAAHALVMSLGCGKALSAGEGGAVLTDDSDLYERLVYLTQHPYRQKRQLGLTHGHEFALNSRMHPISAVLAVESMPHALRAVEERRRWAMGVIRAMNESGLIEPLDYVRLGLAPSFHALTAAWAGQAEPQRLRESLAREGYLVSISPVLLEPLYRHTALRALVPEGRWKCCPTAESQLLRRFQVAPAASLGTSSGGGT